MSRSDFTTDAIFRKSAEALLERLLNQLDEVDYDELPAVANLETASSGTEIHEGVANNTYFDWELGDEAATAKALESAAKVVKLTVRNNRLIPNATKVCFSRI